MPLVKNRLFSGGDVKAGYIRNFCSTAKVNGMKYRLADDYVGVSANPTVNPWYWIVKVEALDGATNLNGLMQVEMTYYTTFLDKKMITDA